MRALLDDEIMACDWSNSTTTTTTKGPHPQGCKAEAITSRFEASQKEKKLEEKATWATGLFLNLPPVPFSLSFSKERQIEMQLKPEGWMLQDFQGLPKEASKNTCRT